MLSFDFSFDSSGALLTACDAALRVAKSSAIAIKEEQYLSSLCTTCVLEM